MIKLPAAMEKVTGALAPGFTKRTHARVRVLLTAAILTVGSRTVLVTLYQPEEQNQKSGRRHRTPSELMHASNAGRSHDLAHFAKRHHRQLTLVSRFYPDANLYAALPKTDGKTAEAVEDH